MWLALLILCKPQNLFSLFSTLRGGICRVLTSDYLISVTRTRQFIIKSFIIILILFPKRFIFSLALSDNSFCDKPSHSNERIKNANAAITILEKWPEKIRHFSSSVMAAFASFILSLFNSCCWTSINITQ